MAQIRSPFERYPSWSYFVLAFAVSWGGIALLPGPIPAPPERIDALLPFVYLAMLAGPALAGVLTIALARGRAGFRELAARALRWRAGIRPYALALLTAPLLALATLLLLALASPAYVPEIAVRGDRASLLLTGLAIGGVVGIFEELGWTGCAVPQLLRHHAVLTTGLIVGFAWGAWHVLLSVWSSGAPGGGLEPTAFLPALVFYAAVLPAYRVLMVWLFDRTDSLLLAVLMHAALTGVAVLTLMPVGLTGAPLTLWYLTFGAALWGVVAVVAILDRERFGRRARPIGRGAAGAMRR